jgi:hypothetical protein
MEVNKRPYKVSAVLNTLAQVEFGVGAHGYGLAAHFGL